MHLPDGLINNGVSAPLLAAAAAFVGHQAWRAKAGFLEKVAAKKIAMSNGFTEVFSGSSWRLSSKGKDFLYKFLAVASFVFAAQMVDFWESGGHSGHIIGAALACLVLGTNLAVVLMSLILLLQAFLLHDGGVLALGLNIINMAIIAVYTCQFVFRRIKVPLLAIFGASFIAVISAAFSYSFVLYTLGSANWQSVATVMEVHLSVAIVEGLLNCLLVYIFFPKLINPENYA